mgnify:CR=1 FL=1
MQPEPNVQLERIKTMSVYHSKTYKCVPEPNVQLERIKTFKMSFCKILDYRPEPNVQLERIKTILEKSKIIRFLARTECPVRKD